MRRAFSTLAVLALTVVMAVPAEAAVTRKKAMWGPLEYGGVAQMPVYADLGVGIYQMTLYWRDIAPTRPANPRDPADPAYRWPADIDRAIGDGARHGISVSLMAMTSPGWANGGREGRWAPERPQDYADFLEAAARRYPQVRHWMIWGEPTKAANFQPMESDNGRSLRGRKLRGPRTYAQLLDAAYVRLKRVSRSNLVIGGNTFTIGTIAPLRFIKALRLPNGRPPRMDLWGHNPFSLRPPNLRAPSLGNGFADFNDLDTLIRTLDANFRKSPVRAQRKLKVFISEFTLPTDHANFEFNFYLDQPTQADWIRRALKITRGWSRIYTFGYLGLYDDPVKPEGDQVERGLIQRDGTRKPAYDAFKGGD
jgi:hypothetical protein